MIASSQLRLTPEQYLDLEAQSPIKHEYINGDVLAMAGTTDAHNIIAGNLYTLIRSHLRGSRCRVYFADIKIRLEHRNCFYYPDLLVTCDPRDQETSTYKRFPTLIIEVLSDSTEAFDRGDKFNDYQTLETLEQYVLVNTKHHRIELFTRQSSSWILTTCTQGSLALSSLDLTIDLMDVYEDVTLETPRIQTGMGQDPSRYPGS